MLLGPKIKNIKIQLKISLKHISKKRSYIKKVKKIKYTLQTVFSV